jgi:hypothetical protein
MRIEIRKERNKMVSNHQKKDLSILGEICVSRSEIKNFTTIPSLN